MILNDLLKEFSQRAVLEYARTRTPRAYVGANLFPGRTVNELTFEYWKSQNLLPVMANVQAFGAEAQIASRDGATKVAGEIPPIKRKIPLNERLLIALKREGAGDANLVKNQLFADIDNLIDSVDARVEKMRIDAISTGEIVLAENGVQMTVDYGVPAGNKEILAASDVAGGYWSYANAEPITKIMEWVDVVVAASGVRPTRILTSNTVVANLLKNASIRKLIYGDNGASRAISINQLNDLLVSMDLPQIATYDLQVRAQAEDGTYSTIRFLPQNKFVLLPPSTCGETLTGPTAEALLSPDITSQEAPGIYATVDVQTEPVGIWTKVAATSIPTFPMADAVFIADVLA